jgi:cation-transporting ATPase E
MAAAILAVYAYGHYTMGDRTLDVESAAFFVLTVTGLWVLGIAARPLGPWKALLVASMAVGLVLVFAIPASRDYHELVVPEPSLARAALVIAGLGCVAIEIAHQITRRSAHRRSRAPQRP